MAGKLNGLRPEDRIGGPPKSKGSGRLLLATLAAIVLVGAAAAFHEGYFGRLDDIVAAPTVSYTEIGIDELPLRVARAATVRPWLDRLLRERCDRDAIKPLADGLKAEGYPRQASNALARFYENCSGDPELLDDAVETLMALSDFKRAHELADILVKADPAYARYRYLRGWAAEKLGMFNESLLDHVDALNLLGDPRNVAGSAFYRVAQAHAHLGQYCEAITLIQQWVGYNAERDTPQTRTLIKEYAENCKEYANASESFSLPVTGDVIKATVSINEVTGTFIIDTGASLVSFSEEFAARANVERDPKNEIQIQTANGVSTATLSSARSVSLGPIEAGNVAVAVVPAGSLGEDSDGLLGMSFLARFKLIVEPDKFTISGIR